MDVCVCGASFDDHVGGERCMHCDCRRFRKLEAEGRALAGGDGVGTAPVAAAEPPRAFDGDGAPGNDVVFGHSEWQPERLDFTVEGDITFNLGQDGEVLAISHIGEIYWQRKRIGRNVELRRRIVAWVGHATIDGQPIPSVTGGINFNAGVGAFPRRPGYQRGAPGRIVFMGKHGPAMVIVNGEFVVGNTRVAPSAIEALLLSFFDDSPPEGGRSHDG